MAYERRPSPGRSVAGLVLWLLVAAAVQLAALDVLRRVFIGTVRGQFLDFAALDGNRIGQTRIDGLVDTVLSTVTVLSVASAILAVGFIALMRGRVALAVAATLLVVGANVTTQLLKHAIERPDLGVDLARAAVGNSLPSGHTTVAASVAVALMLVLPPRMRGVAAVLGAGFATVTGVATLSAGWHRPSDAVAALLVVGIWAALAGVALAVTERPAGRAPRAAPPHRFALIMLVVAGFALLLVAAVAMVVTDRAVSNPVELLSQGRLLVAYVGGAAGIAGVASLVMALVLATAHLTVPQRADRGRPDPPTGSEAARLAVPAPVR